ncbi:DUF262 domain-containing protein [Xanthomonas sacchari]|uniref:DUF262 domain-containing protein n=1 Tax=Xanthomonas sacchari TaxID=56458 RepID=UPI00225831AA|nr:DUF262 domain-containing protein [Xanthomonas sacchari]MCW0413206.1 hypothetical protein [Xanthomonas sacchari]UYK64770.1 DUF262 domain-containing protein [Xanthomonas sacchari]
MSSSQHLEYGDGGDENQGSANLLEDKYRKQMRQIYPQKIELPISTLQQMISDQITLNPEFQRRGRWDNKRKSRFIESLIMNVPVPPVFLGEDEYGSYVVLDGRQRLTALHEFLSNTYELEGLTVWSELNTKRYVDLVKEGLHKALTRRFIPAILLLKESSPEVKYDVFDRLNTGGVRANEMEIRNAVFRGGFTTLLHELSGSTTFRRLWGIPTDQHKLEDDPIYSAMEDVEFVLRFFAVQDAGAIDGRFKDYLSLYLKQRNEAYGADAGLVNQDRYLFERAVSNAANLLGDEAFMRKSKDGKDRRSAPLSDAILYGMARIDSTLIVDGDQALAREAKDALLTDPAFLGAITSGTNGKGAIGLRTSAARNAFEAALPHAAKA